MADGDEGGDMPSSGHGAGAREWVFGADIVVGGEGGVGVVVDRRSMLGDVERSLMYSSSSLMAEVVLGREGDADGAL